jgi:hypothetical protein
LIFSFISYYLFFFLRSETNIHICWQYFAIEGEEIGGRAGEKRSRRRWQYTEIRSEGRETGDREGT